MRIRAMRLRRAERPVPPTPPATVAAPSAPTLGREDRDTLSRYHHLLIHLGCAIAVFCDQVFASTACRRAYAYSTHAEGREALAALVAAELVPLVAAATTRTHACPCHPDRPCYTCRRALVARRGVRSMLLCFKGSPKWACEMGGVMEDIVDLYAELDSARLG